MPSECIGVSIGVDLSNKRRRGTAIVAAALMQNGRKKVIHVELAKMTNPQLIRRLFYLNDCLSPGAVVIETNSQQEAVVDTINDMAQQDHNVQQVEARSLKAVVISFITGGNKADADFGIPGLEIQFENHAWLIPGALRKAHGRVCRRGVDHGKCSWCAFIEALENFPNTAYGDAVMALWFCDFGIARIRGRSGQGDAFAAAGVIGHDAGERRNADSGMGMSVSELVTGFAWEQSGADLVASESGGFPW